MKNMSQILEKVRFLCYDRYNGFRVALFVQRSDTLNIN